MSVPIGEVCYCNGKAEAASGAPTCEKRVNTFSYCGTGGSFSF